MKDPHPNQSGFRTVLQYTGIPPSWLDKRPRLPSRNWLIFLSITQSLIGFYVYDRHQSRKIRQEYVDRVKHLAEEPLQSLDFPRTVTVYSAKWPGDDDWDRGSRYFRKYVKVCSFV
jgi:mitochondrial import inner membrane translocase subunit TIM54